MNIAFDASLKIAGVSILPWNRLGLERWLPNFKIASLFGWGSDDVRPVPPNLSLGAEGATGLKRLNTHQLLQASEFQNLLQNDLLGYDFLTYKAVTLSPELRDCKFIMSDVDLAAPYENKIHFRELFSDQINLPPYQIFDRSGLTPDQDSYAAASLWPVFVMQDEKLSGGRGTYIVSSFEDYQTALYKLEATSRSSRLVVSKYIEGLERSIQCCVTQKGVYVGPLQRQIVRDPLLCNLNTDSDKFCGGLISQADQGTPEHQAAEKAARIIGGQMQAAGYRGIFGVDFLLDEAGQLYTLEVNPRLTGMTPLLNALYQEGQVPFYLLHALELGRYSYQILDETHDYNNAGCLLILHSKLYQPATVEASPLSGTYKLDNSHPQRLNGNIAVAELGEGEFVLQNFASPGMTIKGGGRLTALYFKGEVIDNLTEKLYNPILQAVEATYGQLILQP